jgi:hypothetical protein
MTASFFRATFSLLVGLATFEAGAAFKLDNAVVVCPSGLPRQEKKAVTMLIEEVEKRTYIRWAQTNAWPPPETPVIVVGTMAELATFPGAGELAQPETTLHAEGFRLTARKSRNRLLVSIVGNDSRGVLFGVGRLLRELSMRPQSVALPEKVDFVTAPRYPLRGHQLGYRPKCNSYDAWDVSTWEQYYRDLAVFGCNAIELIPPRSDDDALSPLFPRPPMEMMVEMSRLADDYGLDVWIWFPAMDPDYSDPRTVQLALTEWGEVFQKLPRLDAVFVPGGDPGHTRPKFLMALLEKQTQNLRRFHPKAQMWVSPQGFNQEWLDEFAGIVNRDRPAWLSGVVFGPQVRVSLPQLRELLPTQYPIRHYPDITHSRQCQFPVPNWDVAYAVTEARECINPRPLGEAEIFRKLQPGTAGFITYSEGCNDDVNKIVWSALGWDPDVKVRNILREYSRYFVGERYSDTFAEGLLALEQNWRGPLLENRGVDGTLSHFQGLEKRASPGVSKNWRFQQALFRAYYDAYTRHRLIHEARAEVQALEKLRDGLTTIGTLQAMAAAESILDRAAATPVKPEWRARILELGDALFASIRMQLSVEKHKAIAVDRGASLDTLDFPLNNRPWLKQQFAKIRKFASDTERVSPLMEIAQWAEPGPGGFYDDLGNISRQPHLLPGLPFKDDPGCLQSARVDFEEDLVVDEPDEKPPGARRLSWIDHAEALYDTPLRVRYTDLDPKATYKLRVTYAGDSFKRKIRLVANEKIEIHALIKKPIPIKPLEFAVPREATANGSLTLSWFGEPGLGGNGRNCQVSEIWLLKKTDPDH